MPDDVPEITQLTEDAKRALLEAIIAAAPKASDARLPGVAQAYALVVGAARGYLPGAPYPTSVNAT
jgi:hypothetical protein